MAGKGITHILFIKFLHKVVAIDEPAEQFLPGVEQLKRRPEYQSLRYYPNSHTRVVVGNFSF